MLTRAATLRERGEYDEALRLYRKALSLLKSEVGEQHPCVALTLHGMADTLNSQGKYAEAVRMCDAALALLGERNLAVANVLCTKANSLSSQGQNAEATRLYEEALLIQVAKVGERHSQVAPTLENIATELSKQGKHDEAMKLYEKSLAAEKLSQGERHPGLATTLGNMAATLHAQGKYGDALRLNEEALSIMKEALGELHPDVAAAQYNAGLVLWEQGNLTKAIAIIAEAFSAYNETLGSAHPETLACRASLEKVRAYAAARGISGAGDMVLLGKDALKTGRYAVARRLYTLAMNEPATMASTERRAKVLFFRSIVHLKLGLPAEALRDAEECASLQAPLGRAPQRVSAAMAAVAVRAKAEKQKDRGNELFKGGKLEAALSAYDAAVAVDPLFAAALYNRGLALLKMGRRDESRTAFSRTLEVATAQGDDTLRKKSEERIKAVSHVER